MAGREPILRRQIDSLDVAHPGVTDDNASRIYPKRRLTRWIKRVGTYFNILVLHILLIIRGVPHRISWGKTDAEDNGSPKNSV
jgi:hypothetical protein